MAGVKHAGRYLIFVMTGLVVRSGQVTYFPSKITVTYADFITPDFVCDVSLPLPSPQCFKNEVLLMLWFAIC